MIEINLSTTRKEADLTNVGGLNLSLLNIKLVLISIISIYLVEPIIDGVYEQDIVEKQQKLEQISQNQKRKTRELDSFKQVEEQVKELEERQRKLKEKISVVQKIVELRQNPFNVLKYIAENTPKDVWIIGLEIENNQLKLVGYSTNFKSIGDFIDNLKTSIFFNGDLSYVKPDGLLSEIDKKRVESFEIKTQIVSY